MGRYASFFDVVPGPTGSLGPFKISVDTTSDQPDFFVDQQIDSPNIELRWHTAEYLEAPYILSWMYTTSAEVRILVKVNNIDAFQFTAISNNGEKQGSRKRLRLTGEYPKRWHSLSIASEGNRNQFSLNTDGTRLNTIKFILLLDHEESSEFDKEPSPSTLGDEKGMNIIEIAHVHVHYLREM